MLKTFIISLVVFVVAYFINRKIGSYLPWEVKASKNKWISGGGMVESFQAPILTVGGVATRECRDFLQALYKRNRQR